MRFAISIGLAAAAVWGQRLPTSLATNRDGSVLYFSSAGVVRGTTQHAWPKIFRWTATEGVRLAAERDAVGWSLAGASRWDGSGPYQLWSPSVSADGTVLAFTGVRDCTFGTPCTTIEKYETTFRIAGRELTATGSARLSANGRYALLESSMGNTYHGSELHEPPVRWLDLLTGQMEQFEEAYSQRAGSHPVTDSGVIVRGSQRLWRPGVGPFLPVFEKALGSDWLGPVALSADGEIAAFRLGAGESSGGFSSSGMLGVSELASGRVKGITSSSRHMPVDISRDGQLILFQDVFPLYTIRADGSGLTPVPGLWQEAVLSGDGRVVYARSSDGVFRIPVGGQAEQVVPASGISGTLVSVDQAAERNRRVARGGLLRLQWVGEAPTAVRFGEESWPAVGVFGGALLVFVPNDAKLDPVGRDLQLWLAMAASDKSPFQRMAVSTPWRVVEVAPVLFGVFRQDWSGAVTPDSPARPGEVVHLYGSGFGNEPPTCTIHGSSGGTFLGEVLYSGSAPGNIPGLQQLDVRVPEEAVSGGMVCEVRDVSDSVNLPVAAH